MTERYGGDEFGLPHLGQVFHHSWRDEWPTEVEALARYVDGAAPYLVEAVLSDALRLADPAVPTWVFETLWSVGTERRLELRSAGIDPRDWLLRIIRLCRERLDREGIGHPQVVGRSPYEHLTGLVLDEIMIVTPGLLELAQDSSWMTVPGVVPALGHAAVHACPDLAFRFLLRALTYGPQLTRKQYERYVELGRRFEYGPFLVAGHEHLMA
ncbi:hypothetical protein OG500_09830 [Kitasatospora sp. NBC_01250]|uniref:hypothetical protein n=1 Tax=Kitasatospora sp. NBC_01250 TaxID=2903571 RepID=UPI002E322948|nr:hypothetical protein [Kitasatospora sp. NBC_01250]